MGNEVSGEISKEDLIEIKRKQLLLEQENKKIKLKLKQQEEQSISKEKTKSSKDLSPIIPSGRKEKSREKPKETSKDLTKESSDMNRKEKNKPPKDIVLPKQKHTIPVQLNSSTIQIDPFTIFSLEPECSIEDIKKVYKQLVLKYHPDKSGYNSTEDYRVIQKAYAVLLSIKEEEGKITGLMTQTIETKTDERKKLDSHLENNTNYHFEPTSGSHFDKKKFNDMFDKNKFVDDENGGGYADWLKQGDVEQAPTIANYTKDGFNNTFDEHVKKHPSSRQLTPYINPESLVSYKGDYVNLGDSVQDYTSDGKFTDLKKAYTVSNILHPGQTVKRDEYTTLQQLKAARDAPMEISVEEKEFINQRQKMELDFETNRVTRMKDKDKKIDDFYTRVHGRAIELPNYRK
jgi:curved DNA-binding protein CbpA